MSKQKQILIIGGGFAGVAAAIKSARIGAGKITLISDSEFFMDKNLIFSSQTKDSQFKLKDILADSPEVKIIKDQIVNIDPEKNLVSGAKKNYKYDQLVLSIGSSNHVSGSDAGEGYSYGMSEHLGSEIYGRLHDLVIGGKEKPANFVIVGGGASGVKLAGYAAEFINQTAESHQILKRPVKITLVEKNDRLLSNLSNTVSQKAARKLAKLGVEVALSNPIRRNSYKTMRINDRSIKSDLTIWATGGQIHPLFLRHQDLFKISKNNRIIVNRQLQAYPDIFIIGDNAEQDDSGSVVGAINQAEFLAEHLFKLNNGQNVRDRGTKGSADNFSITRRWAYVERFGIYVDGFFGALTYEWLNYKNYRRIFSPDYAKKLIENDRNFSTKCRLCKKISKRREK